MTYTHHLSLLIVQGQETRASGASQSGSSEGAAPHHIHFNYCQSNLSTPPHPGSLSTRYALSSFKRNLLKTSKARQCTSVPELAVQHQITQRCTLHTWAAAQGLEDTCSACEGSTARNLNFACEIFMLISTSSLFCNFSHCRTGTTIDFPICCLLVNM